jgi:hypothetical protein
MREGERAKIHVPPQLGYGGSDMGSKGSGWFIPGNSREIRRCFFELSSRTASKKNNPVCLYADLLFDIEILSKAGAAGPDREL